MAIDKGATILQTFVKLGYVKTVSSGYIWTEKGIEYLANSIQELYHLHNHHFHQSPFVKPELSRDTDTGNQE